MNGNEKEIKLPKLICMADVEEKEAEWLTPNYLARACINMMAGDGGSGKTTTWCGIAAGVSAGTRVFFDAVPEEFAKCEPQKVLFFSSEDSVEHTLRARLRKAGANLNNILSVSLQDESFGEIKFNSAILEKLIDEVRPALIIFDPIQSFIPPDMQMGQRNAMRNCLNPLIGWGEKYGCTFLIVVHTNKRQGVFGRNRVADSADIWDISRSVLIVGQTQDGKRYLSHVSIFYKNPVKSRVSSS
ncbi:AAA family ATPase [Lachnospiraceae bacterium 45-P1]